MKQHSTAQHCKSKSKQCLTALIFFLMLSPFASKAQTFNSATSSETIFPSPSSSPSYYLDDQIHYLQCNSHWVYYAPPYYDAQSALAAWSHKMYVDAFGNSATDGGGFSYGIINPITGTYIGYGAIAMPNASNISVAYLYGGLCQENFIVTWAEPYYTGNAECYPYCNYYYQFYNWTHTSAPPTPIGTPVLLTSGAYFDRISLDVNKDANKAVITWGHNTSAVFAKAFDFTTTTLGVGPNVTITNKGNLPDVAFRTDPTSGDDYLHFAFFNYFDYSDTMGGCNRKTFKNDLYADPTFVEGYTTFDDVYNFTYTGLTYQDYDPSFYGLLGSRVDTVNVNIDCPDMHADPNWSFTWSKINEDTVYIRTFKDGVTIPGDPAWLGNDRITPGGFSPRFTSGKYPAIGYHPSGNTYFVGFVGGPNGYVAEQIDDLGALVSSTDYLNVPNNTYAVRDNPRIAVSKNSTGDYLYNVFLQEDDLGGYSLVHKAHPWASSSSWRKSENNTLSTEYNHKTNIYPIPFDNEIKFVVPQEQTNELWTVIISEISGKQIFNIKDTYEGVNQFLSTNAPKLSSGTYIFQTISAKGDKKHFKVIKK